MSTNKPDPSHQAASSLNLRKAARAILFDPDDRVLFVRFEWADGGMWSLPGGGIDPGETELEAAIREVAEETGLAHSPLVGPVWIRTAIFDQMKNYDGQLEHYFTARVTDTELQPTMTTAELNAENLHGAKWWHIDDIIASTDNFGPAAVGTLLADLRRDGPPDEPLHIGN